MSNITITNNDTGSVALEVDGVTDGLLHNAALTTEDFAEGTILARHSGDGKFYPYDPAAVANDLNVPKYVLPYAVSGVATATDVAITAMSAGKVNKNRLVIHDGTPLAAAHLDALLDRPIVPVDVKQLAKIDNPQS